jgi:ribosome maturation factor RimP
MLKLRVTLKGQRNFIGTLREVDDGVLKLEVNGETLDLELNNIEKVRLVPKL